ncbi:MAG TPA: aminoacyl-tRNA hydrolase [Firmicutes bacterium]|nr:aminoacyl-tRNA hydrolase [Bacillota bacterium]
MRLIVGLGNPGSSYEGSRHNVGFMVVDTIGRDLGIAFTEKRHHALVGSGIFTGEGLVLAKPLTYMNRSGIAVKALLDAYSLNPCDLVVIYDDMDLEPGRVRVRPRGSSGGHNGMKSIIEELGTDLFPRIRVGIGRPDPSQDPAGYVLGWFTKEELEMMTVAIQRAAAAAKALLTRGIAEVMNEFNGI